MNTMLRPVNILTVAAMAFVGVWVINHALGAMNLTQYKA